MEYGIAGQQAPNWSVAKWLGPNGKSIAPIQLDSLGYGYKVIYCFQSWCPGCHSHGFPSLQKMVKALEGLPVHFIAVQTVFEGHDENTFEKVVEIQKKYDLKIPFGHDSNKSSSDIMSKYRSGGTPWYIIIDPANRVVFNDFHIPVDEAIEFFKENTKKLEVK